MRFLVFLILFLGFYLCNAEDLNFPDGRCQPYVTALQRLTEHTAGIINELVPELQKGALLNRSTSLLPWFYGFSTFRPRVFAILDAHNYTEFRARAMSASYFLMNNDTEVAMKGKILISRLNPTTNIFENVLLDCDLVSRCYSPTTWQIVDFRVLNDINWTAQRHQL